MYNRIFRIALVSICHRNHLPLLCLALLAATIISTGAPAEAVVIKVASYNVENLFDAACDGTEYPDFIPNGDTGWNHKLFALKVDHVARVIKDLDADIVALQEIESAAALNRLQEHLRKSGAAYSYAALADKTKTAVRCAVLSRYRMDENRAIVIGRPGARDILRVTFEINGNPLVLFVNHWKSKSGPESRRMAEARVLRTAISTLPPDTDYLLLGDFNSDYDEFNTLAANPELNDTSGRTGIHHVLQTLADDRLVDEALLAGQTGGRLHYDLWMEIEPRRRWSTDYFGRRQSPDHILVPAALYDGRGISYVDNTFDTFDPGYLFSGGRIFRWQRARGGTGAHLGAGYSDHLPIYACFTDSPFSFDKGPGASAAQPETAAISDLYRSETGAAYYQLNNCAVIYKNGTSAVIKQQDGRAVYVYKSAGVLEAGRVYDLSVRQLYRHYGNLEITEVENVVEQKKRIKPTDFFISEQHIEDLSDPRFENEILTQMTGRYDGRWFHYGAGRRIRLYFPDKSLAPKNAGPVQISNARIGFHKTAELVIERKEQLWEKK